MADAIDDTRLQLLQQFYRVLFALTFSGCTLIFVFIVGVMQRWENLIEQPVMWAIGGIGLGVGYIASDATLFMPRLHTAYRLVGGLGTLGCAVGAVFCFTQSALIDGWDGLGAFIYGIMWVTIGSVTVLIALCGVVGRRCERWRIALHETRNPPGRDGLAI